jgi:anti-sigma-K factor RskA
VNHEDWLASAAAYALDSLDEGERAEFEGHLGTCMECRRAVRDFQEVAGLLVHAAPNVAAPSSLRTRVLEQVRSADVQISRTRGRRPSVGLAWLSAAAGVVLALTGALLAGRARSDSDIMAVRMASMDSTLTAFLGPEVHSASLAGAADAKPVARVFWNHLSKQFIVTAFALPPAPDGRTYQLWAIAEGKTPVSMGTFETDADGHATVLLPVDPTIEELGFIDLCALTVEPEGGSEQPSEAPRLSGAWRHAD